MKKNLYSIALLLNLLFTNQIEAHFLEKLKKHVFSNSKTYTIATAVVGILLLKSIYKNSKSSDASPNNNSISQKKEVEEEKNNFEIINSIHSDLFIDAIAQYLFIDISTPEKLIHSLKELIKNRTVSSSWSKCLTDDYIIKFIKDSKINVNITDENGNTALHIAAKKGYIKLVKILLACGANANAEVHYRDKILKDGLFLKSRFPFLPQIKTLYSLIIHVYKLQPTPLKFYNHIDGISILKWLPIHDAMYNKHYDIVQILCNSTDFCQNSNNFNPGYLVSHTIDNGQGLLHSLAIPLHKIVAVNDKIYDNIRKVDHIRYIVERFR